ncbi:unnamed protein product, partial [Dovyalis caffra]
MEMGNREDWDPFSYNGEEAKQKKADILHGSKELVRGGGGLRRPLLCMLNAD